MNPIHVAAVIPALNVGSAIGGVLREMPALITTIVVVDDGSTDDTAAVIEQCARQDRRIHLIRHASNGGVGAAMVTGFRTALQLEAAIIVKIDGDGQMPLWLLPKLIAPLISGEADYVKGNRFRDVQALHKMPALRRFGNVALSFLAKAATGYWHCFDPTNGFVAIRADVLSQLPLHRIDTTYFFEISMLIHLYLLGAVVKEQPMPPRYAGEPSSLSIPRVLIGFPGRLLRAFVRRIVFKNFVYDFTIGSLHIAAGVPLLIAGMVYGGYNWYWYTSHRLAAPTGTVVLSALLIILGFQLLLSAISFDLQAVPRIPINEGSLAEVPSRLEGNDRR
ncbi:MAG TPA: glycosyltransferase family 2 protein [Thermoanaerobaculia bacterium]|jgi:glycosyltransferase involved in cell wall biosynthesis|nr:glycosyltransferase family 2 protein [Thermoanaerobaculia bacterium]